MNRGKKLAVFGLCCTGALILLILVLKLLEALDIRDLRYEPTHNMLLIVPGVLLLTLNSVSCLMVLFSRKQIVSLNLRLALILNMVVLLVIVVVFANGYLDPYRNYKLPGQSAPIANVRLLSTVQAMYYQKYGTYATLTQLGDEGYIDPVLTTGTKQGFRFILTNVTDSTYCAHATPVVWGERIIKHKHWIERDVTIGNFMMSQDGVIYVNYSEDNTGDWIPI